MSDINRMDLTEFVKFGFLQEANRCFFHPLGLALEVEWEGDPETGRAVCLSGVWDYRDDPEGMMFGEDMIEADKIEAVDAERMKHKIARIEMLGHDGPQRPEDTLRT